jgi:diguanylate cyclase (GGDEF)-like protein/PAS domain S-box-containing protein
MSSIAADPPWEGIDFRSLVQNSVDLITVASLEGVYTFVSTACHRLFGWVPAELEGRSEEDFVHPDDLPLLHKARASLANTAAITTRHRFSCRDGSSRWVETTSRLANMAGLTLVVAAVRDITERPAVAASLELRAFTDPLTGVANRPVLIDRLRQGLHRLARGGGALAVLYVGVDRFKVVNDSLGHSTGDATLVQLAERLLRCLRPADTLAHLGGDEFVKIAETLGDGQSAVRLAERILEAAREPFRVGDEDFVCTVSIGIAWTTNFA